jgi:hypothetical protein
MIDKPSAARPHKLSTSKIACWQACPRKFFHTHVEGVEAKAPPSRPLQVGTAVHKLLETGGLDAIDSFVTDADDVAFCTGVYEAYRKHYASDTLKFECAEVELFAPLESTPAFKLTGTLDALATDHRGERVVVDHKTTSSRTDPGSWYLEKLIVNSQATNYLNLAVANGLKPDRAVWNIIKLPKLSRRTTARAPEYYQRSGPWGKAGDLRTPGYDPETPDQFCDLVRDTMLANPVEHFIRVDVTRFDSELAEGLIEANQVAQQILSAWDTGAFPRNTNSCFNFGAQCEFWPVCTGSATTSDRQLYQLRTRKDSYVDDPR